MSARRTFFGADVTGDAAGVQALTRLRRANERSSRPKTLGRDIGRKVGFGRKRTVAGHDLGRIVRRLEVPIGRGNHAVDGAAPAPVEIWIVAA